MQTSPRGLRRPGALAYAVAMGVVVVTTATGYWGLSRLDAVARGLQRGDAALAVAAEDLREDVLELRRYEKDVFLNVGEQDLVRQYRAKWDAAFLRLRYDLGRAHSATGDSQEPKLEQVTRWIGEYREAFGQIYEAISNGSIRSTEEANEQMGRFKGSVRSAELTLAETGDEARARAPALDPAVLAQRIGVALGLLGVAILAALLVRSLRAPPAPGGA
ncbi:MAG: hypothetical protein JSR73_08605 [Proteobacteria bacterium]|nr:hypothetical protein [Pseudomonadota bacterium]